MGYSRLKCDCTSRSIMTLLTDATLLKLSLERDRRPSEHKFDIQFSEQFFDNAITFTLS